MEDSHRAVMAVDTSTCLLVRSVVSVLFMFDSKPESMNRGEVRSFSQATVMYTVAAANNAQHSAGQPMCPVEDAIWPSTPETAANSAIQCVSNVNVCPSQSSGKPKDECSCTA
jgi:hypothetical protein